MTRTQRAQLRELAKSPDADTRLKALRALAPSLKGKPRSELSADELWAVREYYANYRQAQRAVRGESLRAKHREYCRDKLEHDTRYQQKKEEYRKAHKEDARAWLKAWREANPDRNKLHRAREAARRKEDRLDAGEDVAQGAAELKLDSEFRLRGARQKDIQAAAQKIAQLESFLKDGKRARGECMQLLHISSEEAFDEFLEKATEVLISLWEDDEGFLGLGG